MKSTITSTIHTPTPENPIRLEILLENPDDVRALWHRLNFTPQKFAELAENTDVVAYPADNDHTVQIWSDVDSIAEKIGVHPGWVEPEWPPKKHGNENAT